MNRGSLWGILFVVILTLSALGVLLYLKGPRPGPRVGGLVEDNTEVIGPVFSGNRAVIFRGGEEEAWIELRNEERHAIQVLVGMEPDPLSVVELRGKGTVADRGFDYVTMGPGEIWRFPLWVNWSKVPESPDTIRQTAVLYALCAQANGEWRRSAEATFNVRLERADATLSSELEALDDGRYRLTVRNGSRESARGSIQVEYPGDHGPKNGRWHLYPAVSGFSLDSGETLAVWLEPRFGIDPGFHGELVIRSGEWSEVHGIEASRMPEEEGELPSDLEWRARTTLLEQSLGQEWSILEIALPVGWKGRTSQEPGETSGVSEEANRFQPELEDSYAAVRQVEEWFRSMVVQDDETESESPEEPAGPLYLLLEFAAPEGIQAPDPEGVRLEIGKTDGLVDSVRTGLDHQCVLRLPWGFQDGAIDDYRISLRARVETGTAYLRSATVYMYAHFDYGLAMEAGEPRVGEDLAARQAALRSPRILVGTPEGADDLSWSPGAEVILPLDILWPTGKGGATGSITVEALADGLRLGRVTMGPFWVESGLVSGHLPIRLPVVWSSGRFLPVRLVVRGAADAGGLVAESTVFFAGPGVSRSPATQRQPEMAALWVEAPWIGEIPAARIIREMGARGANLPAEGLPLAGGISWYRVPAGIEGLLAVQLVNADASSGFEVTLYDSLGKRIAPRGRAEHVSEVVVPREETMYMRLQHEVPERSDTEVMVVFKLMR